MTVTRTGNQKHYKARRDSPIFAELHGLVVKTIGLAGPLRKALEHQAEAIRAAFVYGSVAKGTDRARSDIDLMVLSDSLRYADLFEALQGAEAVLGTDHQSDGDDGGPVADEARAGRLVRGPGRRPAARLRHRIRR